VSENTERLKELACLNQTTRLLKEGKPINDTFEQLCEILRVAWQYPDYTAVRISYDGSKYTTKEFQVTKWKQSQAFDTIDHKSGLIEVFYLAEFEEMDEGPFLSEERNLLENIATIISGHLNSLKGKEFIKKSTDIVYPQLMQEVDEKKQFTRQLLQQFLNKHNANRDVFHDLMPFKVKEILLVATLYDAYSIEKEGRFTEQILGEYHQLNLTQMPRVTGASTSEEAMEQLANKHFDLVIIMLGADRKSPLELSMEIKARFNYIQIFLLLHNNNDIAYLKTQNCDLAAIDKVFVWNGDSKVFFAMVKSIEDWINVENDTAVGMVGIILLVEDSIKYYSRYLPLLYSIVLEQTKDLIEEVVTDELYKVLRLRARPKIVLASNYEEAKYIYNKYQENILCLITDMEFEKEGVSIKNAGELLIKDIRSSRKDLPTIIQSSDPDNANIAYNLKVSFIDKNSETLGQDIRSFINYYLGFGNFVYRNAEGREIAVARTLREFEAQLKTIPDESLIYHAKRNHFSQWLMARGEIQAARIIHPIMVSDFKSPGELRNFLINIIQTFRHEQKRGKVVAFHESSINDESNIVSLCSGALGGKGRGLAFINNLIYDFNIEQFIDGIHIKSPKTSIIGTDEFEIFMERNQLRNVVLESNDYSQIRKLFVEGALSENLKKRLRKMLKVLKKPLAVRSSGLFEDSLTEPFAGIFETYKLPNNHKDLDVRHEQLMTAIKLVYASVYSGIAKGYVEAINHKIEEEKMAVVIQEVVGNQYGDYFYPHISGVAQSYNYYPISHMEPEDGYAVLALGLGKYVVEGEKAFRFSPKYPTTQNNTAKDLYKNSQVDFFAVDLSNQKPDLLANEDAGLVKIDISEAENHGTLKHTASVYDSDGDRINPGLDKPGPRVVNFANILKYNYIPLAHTLEVIVDIVKEALGTPVEIEFAIDLNKDKDYKASFYLLQIKPLIGSAADYEIDMESIRDDEVILYSEKGMGNGVIDDIYDIIYVDIANFDKTETIEMVNEINNLNQKMKEMDRKYILIGPGRWGTRDRFIGIPVSWPQISNAQIIVETSLKDFPLDASLGSHFFHNVTSLGIGYFSVQPEMSDSYINYNMFEKEKLIQKTKYFRHVQFEKPVLVRMDGKERKSVITIQ
ncbi:MAG: hypothetical protein C0594_06855, partial [Marinilabiliales bacterium]